MASIDWPTGDGTFPQILTFNGLNNTLPDGTIRTQTDIGPEKVRRRFTAAPEPISGSLVLTQEHTLILDSFFSSTTKMGSLPFNWIHPRTLQAGEFRFKSPPSYMGNSDGIYTANLEVEILP